MKKGIIIIPLILIVIGILISSVILQFFIRSSEQNQADSIVLREVSTLLGVKENWEAIQEEVDCIILNYGKNSYEISSEMKPLEPYYDLLIRNFGGSEYYEYRFTGSRLYNNLGIITLTFDEERLLIYKSASTGIADERPMVCP